MCRVTIHDPTHMVLHQSIVSCHLQRDAASVNVMKLQGLAYLKTPLCYRALFPSPLDLYF